MRNDIFSQHSLDFSDIVKHKNENAKKIKFMLETIKRSLKNIKKLPYICNYNEQITENRIAYENNVYAITGAKEYSNQLAFLNECQQWFAVYFMYNDIAKSLDERMHIIENLFYVSEITIHSTLKHFNFERKEPLEWDIDTFYSNEDIRDPNIVDHVVENLDHLCNFICAVDKNDTKTVYETYVKICESRMQQNTDNPFPEFN